MYSWSHLESEAESGAIAEYFYSVTLFMEQIIGAGLTMKMYLPGK